jgi:hypothetical protein
MDIERSRRRFQIDTAARFERIQADVSGTAPKKGLTLRG